MKYKIDTTIPLPPIGVLSGHKRKPHGPSIEETLDALVYPSTTTSFLVPLKSQKVESLRAKILYQTGQYRKKHPERKFATRYIHKEKGIRVWRIQ
jgi:hypothetical protein